jgi:hypothetical protein
MTMEITQWYSIALGGFVAVLFLYSLARSFPPLSPASLYSLRHQHLAYACTKWGVSFHPDLYIVLFFIAANIVSLVIVVGDKQQLARRSGLLSTINLIPLSFGASMNVIANFFGIGLTTYAKLHRWLGRISILQALLHVVVVVSLKRPDLQKRADVAGLVVSVSLTPPV